MTACLMGCERREMNTKNNFKENEGEYYETI